MLRTLRQAIQASEQDIFGALQRDLKRSELDAYTAEVGSCLAEIRFAIRHLRRWIKGRRVGGSKLFPLSRGRVVPEPLGVCLIMSPWNYPFRLAISPLIASIAAGNCAILKPSEVSGHTERVIQEMIAEHFEARSVAVVCGGSEVAQELLEQRFDHIFYTGSEAVGQAVMAAAARHTTPVTLELGGKSPCVVDETCDVKKAARRIVWGKYLNAGQTCVAPDFLLVHRNVKTRLVEEMKASIRKFYGKSPQDSADYGRIINTRHFDRLRKLLTEGELIIGGQVDREDLFIAPALMENVPRDSVLMNEEIFGPMLPLVEFANVSEAIDLINRRAKPLVLYIFSGDRDFQREIVSLTSSGGVCLNDTVVHLSALNLPFGGVGGSGFGRCQGKAGFDTFSNPKSVFRQTTLFDIPKRFPPSDKLGFRLLRFLLR
jgi:acyl-CoA reductase-like NAD-dependent aldehyde dehydrogenase